jgi:hypothetical protein
MTLLTIEGKLISFHKIVAGKNTIVIPDGTAAGVYLCRFVGADGGIFQQRIVYQP